MIHADVVTGVKTDNVYGNFFLRGSDLLALPATDCDKAYTLELSHDEKQALTNEVVTVQAALL